MAVLKKLIHDITIALTRLFAPLMPDRSPVTLVGPGSAKALCAAIAQSGVTTCLVVTDQGLVDLGLVGRVTGDLEAAGVTATVYSGVQPDPTFTQVEEGLALLRRVGAHAVIAIGGGSPMDAAKIIATMATNDKPLRKLVGWFRVRKPPLPLYAIPTTAGTGSEVTIAAVVSDPVTHTKNFIVDPKLVPAMAALDASLMTGLPPHITAATGMDALTHAVESYLAPTSTAQTARYATMAVRLIFENLPTAHADGTDLPARSAMALASFYAGLAFSRTSVGYVHAIAHNLGATYGTPHGWANALVLPHVLEFSAEPARARLAQLADVVGIAGASDTDKSRCFIDAVRALKEGVGIPPTLPDLKRADIPLIAKRALAEAWANYPVPRYMNQAQAEALIAKLVA
jgi:alcohol dehydrogenase class IV